MQSLVDINKKKTLLQQRNPKTFEMDSPSSGGLGAVVPAVGDDGPQQVGTNLLPAIIDVVVLAAVAV